MTSTTYPHALQQDVAALHDAFQMPNRSLTPGALPTGRRELRLALMQEEGVDELSAELANRNPVMTIDALIDTMYVTLGTLVEMGISVYSDELPKLEAQRSSVDIEILFDEAQTALERNRVYIVQLADLFGRSHLFLEQAQCLTYITGNAITPLIKAGLDVQPFWDEVQRSNMSKLGTDGKPIHSRGYELDGKPEGKTLKGPNFSEADLASVFAGYTGDRE
jgi:predicted HAD superfamily Cof-like phosphohydrolase